MLAAAAQSAAGFVVVSSGARSAAGSWFCNFCRCGSGECPSFSFALKSRHSEIVAGDAVKTLRLGVLQLSVAAVVASRGVW
jgi:hypothetical protein